MMEKSKTVNENELHVETLKKQVNYRYFIYDLIKTLQLYNCYKYVDT